MVQTFTDNDKKISKPTRGSFHILRLTLERLYDTGGKPSVAPGIILHTISFHSNKRVYYFLSIL